MTAGSLTRLRAAAAITLALAALLVPAESAFAEGSATINVGAETLGRNGLMGYSTTNAPYWHGYTVLRVYAQAGETIQMGSSAMGLGGSADIRLYAPGTSFASATEPGWRATFPTDPVFGTASLDCNAAQPGSGRIASRAEEKAGPLPSPGGYSPCQFTAPADGIYAVLMTPFGLNNTSPGTNTVANPVVTTSQQAAISIWDVTVRDAAGSVQSGRVFTNVFDINSQVFGTPAAFSAFAYTPAGHLYRLQLNAPNGQAWDLAINGSGVVDAGTGQPIFASFNWASFGALYPPTPQPQFTQALAPQMYSGDEALDGRWPIFIQPPSPAAISGPGGLAETRGYATEPWAPEGGLSEALSFTGVGGTPGVTAPEAGGTIEIDAPPLRGLAYKLVLDLDKNGSFGGGADREDAGVIAASGNTFAWDGRDATGAVVPCGTYAYQATSSLPTMHVVQADTENEAGIELERLTLPSDPLLGDPKLAAYNDVDPYKAIAVTNASPGAVAEGTSGPTFHGYSGSTGHTDFIDTWIPVRATTGTGTFQVCPTVAPPPPGNPPTGNPPTGNPPSGNPPAQNPPPQTPSTTPPPATPPKGPKPPKHQQPPAPPRLVIEKTANASRARPSSVVGYTITLWNKGEAAARNVEVCDEPSSELTILRSEPTAWGKGSTCWKLKSLAGGKERVFRVTAQVASAANLGTVRNVATVSAANVKGVRADAADVRVKPLPDTACGSRAFRPGIAPRC